MLRPTQRAFLSAYRESGNITLASRAAKTGRRSHYDWLSEDEYVAAFSDAEQEAGDHLEAEARRRAVEGVERPVFYQGVECGAIREYSDRLLETLLKAKRPDQYRDNQRLEHVGANGAPLSIEVKFVTPEKAG